jgi:hypothetical protein
MRFIHAVVILSAFAFSVTTSSASAAEKRFSVGGGVYVSTMSASGYADDDFAGLALTGTAAFNNHFGVRLNLFSLEHDDLSGLDSSGFDLLALIGYNLANEGFKFYGGLGVFRDKLEYAGLSETFSGPQLNLGLGYNWSQVALDFSVSFRDSDDYEDVFGASMDVTSGLLSLAYRF